MTQQAEPRWLALLRSQLGVEEVAGEGNNPTVVGYFERVTGQRLPDSTPWCAAVLGWAVMGAGYAPPAELPFWARSWLDWGVPLEAPVLGCIVVYQRGGPETGHVNLFLRMTEDGRVEGLGGNQSNRVSVMTMPASAVLGYRWPAGEPMSADDHAAAAAMPTVRRVQERLVQLGYHEVGRVDGAYGSRTRAALNGFRADNGLPLDAGEAMHLSEEDLRVLFVEDHFRTVSVDRQTATVQDLRREGSSTIANADVIQTTAVVVGSGTLIGKVGEWATQATAALRPLRTAFEQLGKWWWVGALVGVGVIAVSAYRVRKARLAQHRTGRTS